MYYKNVREGGLRMINISFFIKELKISWLRRVLQNSQNNTWYFLSKINFTSVFSFGHGYTAQLQTDIDNPFWKDVLSSWINYCDKLEVENVKQVFDSPIWYNSNMTRGRTFYINDWFRKGVRLMSDLVDSNGNIYQFERFKKVYGVRGTFLAYQALIMKIPNVWKNMINENKPFCMTIGINTICSMLK